MSCFTGPIEGDIFLKYRPFPETPSNELSAHWHEIAASFVFYEVLFYVISPAVNGWLFGEHYSKQSNKKLKTNFDIHTVSMVQCIASVLMTIPMFQHEYFSTDPLFGKTDFGGLVASVTIGYFIWDLIICIQYYSLFGIGFFIHAFAALYVFLTTFIYCQPLIPAFLIFELSTPFVNINWFSSRLPDGYISNKFTIINGLLLMITFFSVRIVWGFYAVFITTQYFYETKDLIKYPFVPFTVLPLNVILDCLNIFWFARMVQIAKKKARGTSSSAAASAAAAVAAVPATVPSKKLD